eukprot:TRINITY_DN22393_c0_g4_i2.p1 TRINITY_DN22393_c0_g4~~TRINITY_DN22393_c0_g4_i2.p1  ORF type:complete len:552 (-),score=107.05 TRINITY_DN22393_c0_g4_i2:50-1663(-)
MAVSTPPPATPPPGASPLVSADARPASAATSLAGAAGAPTAAANAAGAAAVNTPRRGALLRQALREKNVQDLLYRSEYLATIVSGSVEYETLPSGEDPAGRLQVSSVPRLVDAAASVLQAKRGDLFASAPRRGPLGTHRPVTPGDLGVRGHVDNMKLRLEKLAASGRQATPRRRDSDIDRHHLFHTAGKSRGVTGRPALTTGTVSVAVADPASMVDDLHSRSMFSDVLDNMQKLVSRHCKTTAEEVRPVLGISQNALGESHHDTAEGDLRVLAERCRHVELLRDDWKPDITVSSLPFAKLFWSGAGGAAATAAATGTEPLVVAATATSPGASALRLLRADGGGEFSAQGFSLMERSTLLLREEGRDPFGSRSLLVGAAPAGIFARGQYTEVQVVSVFKATARPERLRQIEPRQRTEGLVLGFTTLPPASLCAKSNGYYMAGHLPCSWSIATSGSFCVTDAAGEASRYQLCWSAAVGEGDTVGLLATGFGGLVLFINGHPEVMVPDAGVSSGGVLYPLIEACNHIRSLRLTAKSPPAL